MGAPNARCTNLPIVKKKKRLTWEWESETEMIQVLGFNDNCFEAYDWSESLLRLVALPLSENVISFHPEDVHKMISIIFFKYRFQCSSLGIADLQRLWDWLECVLTAALKPFTEKNDSFQFESRVFIRVRDWPTFRPDQGLTPIYKHERKVNNRVFPCRSWASAISLDFLSNFPVGLSPGRLLDGVTWFV